jgi:hypothetical protein
METKAKITWTVVSFVFVALVSFPTLCVLQAYYERWKAQKLVEDLQYLNVGVTSEQEALRIFSEFHPDTQRMGGRIGGLNVEGPGYSANNHGMALLHMEPPAQIGVSLFFYKGLLVAKNAGFDRGKGRVCCSVDISEETAEFSTFPPTMMPNGIHIEERGNGVAELVIVHIDHRVSADARKIIYGFNYSCLTAISGCKDADDLLPGISHVADELRTKSR